MGSAPGEHPDRRNQVSQAVRDDDPGLFEERGVNLAGLNANGNPLQACRRERTEGTLVLRPVSGKPIDRRAVYRMVLRIARVAWHPRHVSPHSLRHAAITKDRSPGPLVALVPADPGQRARKAFP